MSWCDRRGALAALALLTGCGFAPVYGPDGAARGLTGEIAIAPPADLAGFTLVRRLEDRLGRAETPRYRLDADLALSSEGLGTLPDESESRYQVRGAAEWVLSDTDGPVTGGEVTGFTGYSATSTTVATIAARRAAIERLSTILADRIVAELLATAPDWR